MKSTTTLSSLFASLALAQTNFPNQSAPFDLQVLSNNATLNSSYLFPCHIGAGLESLCIVDQTPDSRYDVYRLNTSSTAASNYNASLGMPGLLTYNLYAEGAGGETVVENEAMSLSVYDTSNTGFLGFGISGQQFLVAFDDKSMMNVQSVYDDTVTPPMDYASPKAYYRWYICQNNFAGYEYFNLNWVLGDSKPQNPSCQKVEIRREFI